MENAFETELKKLDQAVKRIPQLSIEELQNRFEWHTPQDAETAKAHSNVRHLCLDLAIALNNVVPEGREKALAITKLEEVMMWSNAGIARNN